MHTHTLSLTHTHTYIYIHAYILTYLHTCMHTHIHIQKKIPTPLFLYFFTDKMSFQEKRRWENKKLVRQLFEEHLEKEDISLLRRSTKRDDNRITFLFLCTSSPRLEAAAEKLRLEMPVRDLPEDAPPPMCCGSLDRMLTTDDEQDYIGTAFACRYREIFMGIENPHTFFRSSLRQMITWDILTRINLGPKVGMHLHDGLDALDEELIGALEDHKIDEAKITSKGAQMQRKEDEMRENYEKSTHTAWAIDEDLKESRSESRREEDGPQEQGLSPSTPTAQVHCIHPARPHRVLPSTLSCESNAAHMFYGLLYLLHCEVFSDGFVPHDPETQREDDPRWQIAKAYKSWFR